MTYFPEADIASRVLDLCRWISEGRVSQIDMGMSLTRDLRFDSLQLMQFFSGIEEYYTGLALEDWFIEHSTGGRDTIGSVVSHIAYCHPAPKATLPYVSQRSNEYRDFVEPSLPRPRAGFHWDVPPPVHIHPKVIQDSEIFDAWNSRVRTEAADALEAGGDPSRLLGPGDEGQSPRRQ